MADAKAKIEKKDGGYYFPELDIHVVAKNEAEAKELVKVGHGIDVDKTAAKIAKAEARNKKLND